MESEESLMLRVERLEQEQAATDGFIEYMIERNTAFRAEMTERFDLLGLSFSTLWDEYISHQHGRPERPTP